MKPVHCYWLRWLCSPATWHFAKFPTSNLQRLTLKSGKSKCKQDLTVATDVHDEAQIIVSVCRHCMEIMVTHGLIANAGSNHWWIFLHKSHWASWIPSFQSCRIALSTVWIMGHVHFISIHVCMPVCVCVFITHITTDCSWPFNFCCPVLSDN